MYDDFPTMTNEIKPVDALSDAPNIKESIKSVLVVGLGGGRIASALLSKHESIHLTGVEKWPHTDEGIAQMIDCMCELSPYEKRASVVCASLTRAEADLKHETFDLVIINRKPTLKLMRQWRRAVAPGGVMVGYNRDNCKVDQFLTETEGRRIERDGVWAVEW